MALTRPYRAPKQLGIETFVCSSCAVASISNVGAFDNPEEVLEHFCKAQLGVKSAFKKELSFYPLICFYVFCAGPEVVSTHPNGSHHSKDHWPRYGTELAQYILNNKLGEIGTTSPKYNLKHHKDTTAQAWIWSPDQKALEAWWAARGAGADPVKSVATAAATPQVLAIADPADDDVEDDWDRDEDDEPYEDEDYLGDEY